VHFFSIARWTRALTFRNLAETSWQVVVHPGRRHEITAESARRGAVPDKIDLRAVQRIGVLGAP